MTASASTPASEAAEVDRLVRRLALLHMRAVDIPVMRDLRVVGFLIQPDEFSTAGDGIAMMDALQRRAGCDLGLIADAIGLGISAPFAMPSRPPTASEGHTDPEKAANAPPAAPTTSSRPGQPQAPQCSHPNHALRPRPPFGWVGRVVAAIRGRAT